MLKSTYCHYSCRRYRLWTTSVPSTVAPDYPEVILQPVALPTLKTLELHEISFETEEEVILPQLRTSVARASPVDDCPNDILQCILERSPQLSEFKVDRCLSRDSSDDSDDSDDSAKPQREDLPKNLLTIIKLELDLIGFRAILSPVADPISVVYEFCKPIKKSTSINHLRTLSHSRPARGLRKRDQTPRRRKQWVHP